MTKVVDSKDRIKKKCICKTLPSTICLACPIEEYAKTLKKPCVKFYETQSTGYQGIYSPDLDSTPNIKALA